MTSLQEVRARFARDLGLPFADSLTQTSIQGALDEHGVKFRDRLFSPVTTIWGFLSQVLSEDKSCRDAVSRVIAHRAASGLEPCSPLLVAPGEVTEAREFPRRGVILWAWGFPVRCAASAALPVFRQAPAPPRAIPACVSFRHRTPSGEL